MKRILILLFTLASISIFGQAYTTVTPGRSILISNFPAASIGGTDTSFKFTFPDGCEAYTIQVNQTDTIETLDTLGVRLYGSMDGGNWIAIGDTITFDTTTTVKYDYWTGTVFPWPFGKVELDAGIVTDGDFTILLWYQK